MEEDWLATSELMIFEVLQDLFYCPEMNGDVHTIISMRSTRRRAKNHILQGIYTSSLVPLWPWEDVGMNFIVALPRTQRGNNENMICKCSIF